MEKILLVEDDGGIASFIRLELMHEGYQLQVAEDGRQALELFSENQWDLVLLDIKHIDSEKHKDLTGASNENVLKADGGDGCITQTILKTKT